MRKLQKDSFFFKRTTKEISKPYWVWVFLAFQMLCPLHLFCPRKWPNFKGKQGHLVGSSKELGTQKITQIKRPRKLHTYTLLVYLYHLCLTAETHVTFIIRLPDLRYPNVIYTACMSFSMNNTGKCPVVFDHLGSKCYQGLKGIFTLLSASTWDTSGLYLLKLLLWHLQTLNLFNNLHSCISG